jgi:hypothetical protein
METSQRIKYIRSNSLLPAFGPFVAPAKSLFAHVLNVVLSVNALHNGDYFGSIRTKRRKKERSTGTSCLSAHHTFALLKVTSHFNDNLFEILKFGKCIWVFWANCTDIFLEDLL